MGDGIPPAPCDCKSDYEVEGRVIADFSDLGKLGVTVEVLQKETARDKWFQSYKVKIVQLRTQELPKPDMAMVQDMQVRLYDRALFLARKVVRKSVRRAKLEMEVRRMARNLGGSRSRERIFEL